MSAPHAECWTRRRFLGGLTLAGAAGLLSWRARPVAAEPPPETRTVRFYKMAGICIAPEYVAEEFLHDEGFTEVQYVESELDIGSPAGLYKRLAAGAIDFGIAFIAPFVVQLDAGLPITLLAGVHIGCFELFGIPTVHSIRDLRGKRVSVPELGASHQLFVASMAAYVGLDPTRDIRWVAHAPAESMPLLAEGKIDALMAFPPFAQEMRARKIGHVVVNSALDHPWSQYSCCLVAGVAGHRDFVQKYPVATKRAVRAFLKATDVCALEPATAARFLVDKGYTPQYDYALQTMQEVPYGKWRQYDPEDTLRFYVLRLHEVGMIKNSPQKLIAQGTDWRFLNELKKELKG
jgi:NitT/TauT family transport system substrate-binding protein